MTVLILNADLSQRCVVDAKTLAWSESPAPNGHGALGSRYRLQSTWSCVGEEIFVVEGAFCDWRDNYQVGSWLRSSHPSQHLLSSQEGCLILVYTGHQIDA